MTSFCCVWKILRAHWRMTLNRLRHANKIIKICYVVFGVVVLGLAVGGGVAVWQLCGLTLRSWLELQMVLPFDSSDIHLHIFVLINNLQEMLLVWIFVLVLPASFSFLLVDLYLSEESELLIAYPVPSWAVFIFQIVDFVAGFLLFPASLVISMLWGAGAAKGYGLGYYVLVLLAMLLQVLLGVGLGVMLLQIVVRVVSPRWVTRGLAVFAIGIILAGYLCYAMDLSLSTYFPLPLNRGLGNSSDWYTIHRGGGICQSRVVLNMTRLW